MQIEKTVAGVKAQVRAWKKEGFSVGLVPTMGYLHEGHKSLIERAVKENDKVVVSVFVNPTQFGPTEDLESYPRDLNADSILCEDAGAALIFAPEVSEMYAENFTTYVNTSSVSAELCGKSRPIHFRGVCTVVNKLFNIATPDRAYFGEKDAHLVGSFHLKLVHRFTGIRHHNFIAVVTRHDSSLLLLFDCFGLDGTSTHIISPAGSTIPVSSFLIQAIFLKYPFLL